MLWECYAALLRDTLDDNARLSFHEAQERMKLYLVTSLKLTPSSPTMLEARDAVLAAAYATDYTDYILFHEAFAKRGAGIGAVAADRYSLTNNGVVESFATGPEIVYTASSLDDSVSSCDTDGIVDAGEQGKLSFTLTNVGATALTGTVGSITSTTTGVSIVGSNVISFPASDPMEPVAGSVTVALAAGVSGAQQLDFEIEIYDPQLGGPRNVAVSIRGNVDEIPAVTATETAEVRTLTPPWTAFSNAPFGVVDPWYRGEANAMNFVWHGSNSDKPSDESLVSPVFTIDGNGSFNLQFDHNWNFEFEGTTYFDGGVVEMSALARRRRRHVRDVVQLDRHPQPSGALRRPPRLPRLPVLEHRFLHRHQGRRHDDPDGVERLRLAAPRRDPHRRGGLRLRHADRHGHVLRRPDQPRQPRAQPGRRELHPFAAHPGHPLVLGDVRRQRATPGSAANTVAGAADLDGDGRADLVMQNTASRRVDLWRTNGGALISGFPIATPAAGWQVVVN